MELVVGAITWVAGSLGASAATAATIGTVGGYAAAGAYVGYSVWSGLNNKQRYEGPRLGDQSVQSSVRGAPLPWVWGKVRISGNLIDGYIEKEAGSGSKGKGFGGKSGGSIPEYFGSFAVTLCEGPICRIDRIWLNNKIWWDREATAAKYGDENAPAIAAERAQYFTLYVGDSAQDPDPTLQAIHNADPENVPPYRHTAYLVFTRLPLADFGNTIPQVSVELLTKCSTTPLPPNKNVWADAGETVSASGGIYGSNMIWVAATSQYWMQSFDQGKVYVYDVDFNYVDEVALTDYRVNSEFCPPCYVASTNEVWVSHRNLANVPPYTDPDYLLYKWTTIDVFDASTRAWKAAFRIKLNGPGPLLYNPVRDEVLAFDWQNSYVPVVLSSAQTVVYERAAFPALVAGEAPAGLPSSALIIDAFNVCALAGWRTCWGFDLSSYRRVFGVQDAAMSTVNNWLAYDAARGLLYWWGPPAASTYPKFHILDLTQGAAETTVDPPTEVAITPTTAPLGFTYIPSLDYLLFRVNTRQTGGDADEYRFMVYSASALVANGTWSAIDEVRWNTTEGTATTPSYITPYIDTSSAVYVQVGDNGLVPLRAPTAEGTVYLYEIVTDLCLAAQLTADDIDVSELTDVVRGYVKSQPMEIVNAITPLMTGFLFDGVESDWKLKFPKRGRASVAAVPEDDLAAHEAGGEMPAPLTVTRLMESELPQRVAVRYMDYALDYQQGTQHVTRKISQAKHFQDVDLPIVFSSDEVMQLCQILMDNAWIERHHYEWALGLEYIHLDPADVIEITEQGVTHEVRITQTEFGGLGITRYQGVRDDIEVYSSAVTASDEVVFPTRTMNILAESDLVMLDIPVLQDSDDAAGAYYAVVPNG